MTSTWVLLLSSDPLITATSRRVCAEAGVRLVVDDGHTDPKPRPAPGAAAPIIALAGAPPGSEPLREPALVLVGSDHPPEGSLPAICGSAPRFLLVSQPDQLVSRSSTPIWRMALDLRVEQVLFLPDEEGALSNRLGRPATDGAEGLVLAVTAGCGGGGASVLAASLARTANTVTPTLLVDLDPLGGGLDLLLGAPDEPGARWPDLTGARGRLLPGSLAGVLPVIDGIQVLSWDREPGAPTKLLVETVESVVGSARREYGVVVLDLPRAPDPAARAAAQLADVALVTLPMEPRAAAASRRVVTALRDLCPDVRLILRESGASWPTAEVIATGLDTPVAGVLRAEPDLLAHLHRGLPPGLRRRGPLSLFSREFLAEQLANLRIQRERVS